MRGRFMSGGAGTRSVPSTRLGSITGVKVTGGVLRVSVAVLPVRWMESSQRDFWLMVSLG